jgi:molybdopterin-containing oxidoreductase family iron-sulfur binding subunit
VAKGIELESLMTMTEVLAMMLQQPTPTSYQLVRQTWQRQLASRGDLEQGWSAALRDGIIAGTAAPTRTATFRPEALARLASAPRRQPAAGELELIFRPDYSVWDGRYANNAWLQELPRPLTKITWENPALLGPATARKLGVDYMDVIEIESGGRKVSAPVWIVEGHAEDCLTLHLGYGRTYAGAVGTGVGVNAYALRTSGSPWFAGGARVS